MEPVRSRHCVQESGSIEGKPRAGQSEVHVSTPIAVVDSPVNGRVAVGSPADIYREYAAFLHAALFRLGVRADEVEDALQDVFVVVHRRLDDFEGRGSVRSWLYSIAVRVARSNRRKRKSWLRWFVGSPVSVDTVAAPDAAPDQRVAEREASALVQAILADFPEKFREVFVLVDIEGLSAVEASDALDVNLNTVYSRLRLARRDFEAALTRHRARETWEERR